MLLPQMVCQDGFFVSHITTDVELPDPGQVKEFLPPYKHPYPLDPRNPVSHGPQIMPEQGPPLQLERARAMEEAMPVIAPAPAAGRRSNTGEFVLTHLEHPAHRRHAGDGGAADVRVARPRIRGLRRRLHHIGESAD